MKALADFLPLFEKPVSLRGFNPPASVGVSLEEYGRVTALSLECCPTWQFTLRESQLCNLRLIFGGNFPLVLFSLTHSKQD